MNRAIGMVTYGLGTIIGFVLVGLLAYWFLQDIAQQKHTVLRNCRVIGGLRYPMKRQGKNLREYLFAGDRDKMPFNWARRGWVYRLSKNEGARSVPTRTS